MLRNVGAFHRSGQPCSRLISVQTNQVNNLFPAICQIIAPDLASERLNCLCDPDWNGSRNSWLSTCGVAEELFNVTNDEFLADAWDDLTYGEQMQMLVDALDHFDDCRCPA